jgi:hypothetical protein
VQFCEAKIELWINALVIVFVEIVYFVADIVLTLRKVGNGASLGGVDFRLDALATDAQRGSQTRWWCESLLIFH